MALTALGRQTAVASTAETLGVLDNDAASPGRAQCSDKQRISKGSQASAAGDQQRSVVVSSAAAKETFSEIAAEEAFSDRRRVGQQDQERQRAALEKAQREPAAAALRSQWQANLPLPDQAAGKEVEHDRDRDDRAGPAGRGACSFCRALITLCPDEQAPVIGDGAAGDAQEDEALE
eukprot:CAMPEP_0115840318 /NCGR_PEP_ID=MMETSP0287-20121206/6708_1 /TAXON_ID=412157 /ORGANISM="Chrysochromulina rotalis, Strain UIO044" /LENGTH=176 /DNA_ID=CAMNT_0003293923 /DNA_START=264 /DNA_END=795 /DNA_ORIENTATION=+